MTCVKETKGMEPMVSKSLRDQHNGTSVKLSSHEFLHEKQATYLLICCIVIDVDAAMYLQLEILGGTWCRLFQCLSVTMVSVRDV